MNNEAAWPTEIRLSPDKRRVTISFETRKPIAFDAEFLRVLSPSAEVQGHNKSQRQTVPGKRNVTVSAIDPVGNYAVRLTFDDGHNTGLFTWSYFTKLAEDRDYLWAGYLGDLAQRGLSRDG